MNKLITLATLTAVLALHPIAHAATLCAKTGAGSAAVVTPVKGTATCRATETAFQTEPAAISVALRSSFDAFISHSLERLNPSLEAAVTDAGTYLVVASGVLFYSPGIVNENVVVQCRLRKVTTAGTIIDVLSTSTTVQYVRKSTYDAFATTATGYFAAGERPVLTCQNYTEATWQAVPVRMKEAKLTAVKISGVVQTYLAPPPIL